MKKKLEQIHRTEILTAKDFKNYYRPLKRSINVSPRSESLDNDLIISMDVKEIFSGKVCKFHFNDGWGAVEPESGNFKLQFLELLDVHLAPLFWDIVEKNK